LLEPSLFQRGFFIAVHHIIPFLQQIIFFLLRLKPKFETTKLCCANTGFLCVAFKQAFPEKNSRYIITYNRLLRQYGYFLLYSFIEINSPPPNLNKLNTST